MTRDDPLHGCQTDPGAFKFRLPVQPLEWREQLGGGCHIEPRAIVPDAEDGLVFLVFLSESDVALWPFRGVLPSVPQQVHKNYRYEARVTAGRESIRDFDRNGACRIPVLELGDHLARHFREA